MPVDDKTKSTKDSNQAANGGTSEAPIDASLLVPETVDGITQPIAAIALTDQVTEARGVNVLIITMLALTRKHWNDFLFLRNCEFLTGPGGQRGEPAEVSRVHMFSSLAWPVGRVMCVG